MKIVDLIIPTRNRLKKLLRTLSSIPAAAEGVTLRTVIVCDGDPETARHLLTNGPPVGRILLNAEHRGSVYSRNMATAAADDAVLYGTDDIVFEGGALEAAILAFQAAFPDDDGVLGFNQVNTPHFSRAGVALVGRTFLLRYPEKRLFYPEYFHFSCQEIARAALSLGKYLFCTEARLIHFHPMQGQDEKDQTHVDARVHRARDLVLSKTREGAGKTWGLPGGD